MKERKIKPPRDHGCFHTKATHQKPEQSKLTKPFFGREKEQQEKDKRKGRASPKIRGTRGIFLPPPQNQKKPIACFSSILADSFHMAKMMVRKLETGRGKPFLCFRWRFSISMGSKMIGQAKMWE